MRCNGVKIRLARMFRSVSLGLVLTGCEESPSDVRLDSAPSLEDARVDDSQVDITDSSPPRPGLLAFPGAEGFGASATGGRGGRVITVTHLSASGPGSLQAALDETGPRTIVFSTSGVVEGVPILTRGDVTIAGQTSPGGITLRGLLIQGDEVCEAPDCPLPTVHPENFIVRHVRIRPAGLDDPNGAGDGLRLHHARLGILDHVSIGNAEDEAVQISFSSDITLQWMLLAETLGSHAEFGGMLINYSDPARGFPLTRITIHHTMWNRIFGRVPEISRENVPDPEVMALELSNNVIYDAERPIYLAAANPQNNAPLHQALNLVGNYVAPNPRTPETYGLLAIEFGPAPMSLTAESSAYLADNHHALAPDRSDYQLVYCCNDFVVTPTEGLPYASNSPLPSWGRTERHPFPAITYSRGDASLVTELANRAGAFPRDPMDDRLMSFPRSGTFESANKATNPKNDALSSHWRNPPGAPADGDGDGMPDAWEVENGLDPALSADGNQTDLSLSTLGVGGYTNLEVYLHARAVEVLTGGR
jgi:hypothetical protein